MPLSPTQPIEALLSKEKNKIAFFSSVVRETAVQQAGKKLICHKRQSPRTKDFRKGVDNA